MKMMLRDILTKEWFEEINSEFSSRFGLMLESVGADGREVRSLSGKPCHPYFCRLIRDSRPGAVRCYANRVLWMNRARKSGRPYIGVCQAGIVLGCVPVVYRGRMLGGMFYGKCLLDKPETLRRQDFGRRFKGFRYIWYELSRAMRRLDIVSERKLVQAGKFLESQLKESLSPHKTAVLRQQKKRLSAEAERKQKRLRGQLPKIEESSPIWPAADFMNFHYDRPVTLAELACLTGLSVFRFAHVFKQATGITPVEYLTSVRIGHARRLLEKTDWEYWEISESAGYRCQSYFIRMFKRVVGVTPQQYRKQLALRGQRKVVSCSRWRKSLIFRKRNIKQSNQEGGG